MFSKQNYTITVDENSQKVIEELADIIEECPIDLTSNDVIDILRSIADNVECDVEGVELEYE